MAYNRPVSRKQMMRRKKQRRRMLARLIPVIIIMVVLLVGAIIFASSGVLEELSYSDKKAELDTYFGEAASDEAIIVENGEYTDGRVTLLNGIPYMNYDVVKSEYVSRFYRDEKLDQILYTNATETLRTTIGTSTYGPTGVEYQLSAPAVAVRGETIYMSFEFLSLFTTLDYNIQGGMDGTPYRIEVYKEPIQIQTAKLSDDKAIRSNPGKKETVVVKPGKGSNVRILGEASGDGVDEGWLKVMTDDLIVGYIEEKHLTNQSTEQINVNVVPELVIPSLTSEEKVVVGWTNIAGQAGNDTIYNQLNYPGLDVISPTWFFLKDNEGSIESIASKDVVNAAHAKGIKVWGLVENMTYSDITTAYILGDSDIRKKVIDTLIGYAVDYGLDGINVDFESLPEEAGEPFIQFIRELSIQTRANNLVLSVDNYVPKAYTNLYNRKEQGVFADYVIIMGYDEHTKGSEIAGSVASLPFVQEGIEKTLEEVPANKVINALPFYTRMWTIADRNDDEMATAPQDENGDLITYKVTECQNLPMQQALDTVASHSGATVTWDDTLKQNIAEWSNGNSKTIIWLEDEQSLDAKLSVMSQLNIGGVAIWQLGYGSQFGFDVINRYY